MTTKRKPTNKQALYSMISSQADTVIARLVQLSKSKNENVALGACKILLNKTLPDIKSVEVVQSNVLDHLIDAAVEKNTPQENEELNVDDMTDDQVREYGESLLEAAHAILKMGKYARKEIQTLQQNIIKTSAPQQTLQQRMDAMSDEEVKAYGERMIKAGQALARTGEYAPITSQMV